MERRKRIRSVLLAEAAGRYGNVITACAAEFGAVLTEYEGDYRMEDHG